MYDRVIALALLIVATIIPINFAEIVVRSEVQLLLGTVIVLYIVLKDAIAGFLFGLSLFVLYFRVYGDKFGLTWKQVLGRNSEWKSNDLATYPYITPTHLEAAQSNVVNEASFNAEVKGVKGVYGEDVYSAQGTDKLMPGYEASTLGEPVSNE
jgi:hypothetical protein